MIRLWPRGHRIDPCRSPLILFCQLEEGSLMPAMFFISQLAFYPFQDVTSCIFFLCSTNVSSSWVDLWDEG